MYLADESSIMPDKSEDNGSYRKRVVVITGSGKGIGRAIATEFAKLGYYTMINDLEQEEELKLVAEEISKKIGDNNSNKVAYVVGDVSDEKIAIALIEETMRRFGRIDTLINTAAISEKVYTKRTDQTTTTSVANSLYKQASPYFTLEEYEIADMYLKGAYYCIREAAKQMVITAYEDKQDVTTRLGTFTGGGHYSIINISSPYDSIPKVEADIYTFSMSGVDPFTSSRVGIKSLTKTVALQLADNGIRVNAIAPGIIATEEIAKIALFLASDDASYITGSLVYADGGLSLSHSNYFLEKDIEED